MVDEVPHHQAEVDVQIVGLGDMVVSIQTRPSRRLYHQANLPCRPSRLSAGAIERTGIGSNGPRTHLRIPHHIPRRTRLRTPLRKPLPIPLRGHAQGTKNPTESTGKNGLEMQVDTRTTGTKETRETNEITETKESKGNGRTKGTIGSREMRRPWLRWIMTRGNLRPLKVCLCLLLSLAQ